MAATFETCSAFEDFYRAERNAIVRGVASALGDHDLATESVDEALARAYERWPEVASMDNPSGWVYRVAVNLGRSRLKRLDLERRKPPPPAREMPDIDAPTDPEVARALDHLPLNLRRVVVLRVHLDWPIDEIAAVLGCPRGTVKSRLHRAFRRLQSALDGRPERPQFARSAADTTRSGVTRTSSSPGTPLRAPYSSARSAPM
jgi:RNA polymerase sigma factor (sigma-70 family)